MMNKGKVYLVGAGPGERELITVKGKEILQQADVVVYDYLVGGGVLTYASPQAEIVSAERLRAGNLCRRPLPKKNELEKRKLSPQHGINEFLVKRAKEGKKVVRLKNGDPFVFARGAEELDSLIKSKVEFAIIPGVSAANAASCLSGIPLTMRGVTASAVFVSGSEDSDKKNGFIDWESLAYAGTVVLYMGVGKLSGIVRKLIQSGRKKTTPAAVLSNISKINQKTVIGTLNDINKKVKKNGIRPPAIVIVGDTVRGERKFNWFRKAKKILFTGISPPRYYEKGIIFHLPLIEIKPLDNYWHLDRLISKAAMFDWIVFTSRFAVLYCWERMFKIGADARIFKNLKIAAIGSSTANKLKEKGISADLLPRRESSLGLLDEFRKRELNKKKILLPRSDIADKGLAKGLKLLGADVYPAAAYRNLMPNNLPDLDLSVFDEIIFTSPSTVRNFKKRYKKLPEGIKAKWIGEVTRKEGERQLLR